MEEGFSTNKPPLFKGIKYDYWKERMIDHFEYIHIDLWNVVENRDYIPYDVQLSETPEASGWSNKSLDFF